MTSQVTFVIVGVATSAVMLFLFGLIALCCKRLIRRTSPEGREKEAKKRRARARKQKVNTVGNVDKDESEEDDGDVQALPANVQAERKIDAADSDDEDDIAPLSPAARRFAVDDDVLGEQGLLIPGSGLPAHRTVSLARGYVRPTQRVVPVYIAEPYVDNSKPMQSAPTFHPPAPGGQRSSTVITSRFSVVDNLL